jgi:uncharacterized membrane protein YeaQ/YmgE (transglycosylase-associated protein family)
MLQCNRNTWWRTELLQAPWNEKADDRSWFHAISSADAARSGRRRRTGSGAMIGIDSIIIMIIVGAIAGWLAGKLVRGFGFGLIWNIVIGIIGAFIGVWLLTRLGIAPGTGFLGSIVNALIGALVLLFIVGLIRRVT